MKTLTREAFGRARDFLKSQARPLERALYEVHFEGAPVQRVLAELSAFQNEDGGFGHALEPDLRTPASSALATRVGLGILIELGVPASHPMVQKSVRYLLDTFDRTTLTWRVAPLDANDYPHAPWWHEEDGSLARTFDNYVIIPRAKLAGFLHHYAQLVTDGWLAAVTESTVGAIETIANLGSGGGDDLGHSLSLAETEALPEATRQRLVNRLKTVVPQAVSRSPEEWLTYSKEPLKLAPSPSSLAAAWLEDILPANLDFLIQTQSPDGAWNPTWTWFGLYPEVWEQACREWRGEITLQTLLCLRAYGRLEC